MPTDEEYLDSLLRDVMESETPKVSTEAEGEAEASDDMSAFLDMLDIPEVANETETAPELPEELLDLPEELLELPEELPELPEELPEELQELPELPEELPELPEELPEELTDLEWAPLDAEAGEEETALPEELLELPDLPEELLDLPELPEELPELPEDMAEPDESPLVLDEQMPDSMVADPDDMGIDDLLAGMSDDADLSDIKSLLDKDDSGEAVEDDLMSLLDGASGYLSDDDDGSDIMALLGGTEKSAADEEQPKNKKAAKKLKLRKKDIPTDGDTMALSPEELDAHLTEKSKTGIISRLFSALTESDDETEEVAKVQSISVENLELLNELETEDKVAAAGKKKKKKEKPPKEKKEKPPKEKKPKKEKPPKVADEPEKPVKRVSKKNILLMFTFSVSLLAAVVALTMLIPDSLERTQAVAAYEAGDYDGVYNLLYGKSKNPSEEMLFHQAEVILIMDRRLDAYAFNKSVGMETEALNALILGVNRHDALRAGELYGADAQVGAIYQEILRILADEYGISESRARELWEMDAEQYTQTLLEMTTGVSFPDVVPTVDDSTGNGADD